MPKEIPVYGMTETDEDRLEEAVRQAGGGVGGICAAITFDWIERIFAKDNVPIPGSFAQQDLGPLIEGQRAYEAYTLGLQYTEDSLVAYGKTRNIAIKQLETGRIDRADGSFGEKPFPTLAKGKAYLLNFSTGASGPRFGHVAALYRSANGIAIRDQNLGQLKVSTVAELQAQYEHVMMGHYQNEVLAQRARAKRGEGTVTAPEYMFWNMYEVVAPTSPPDQTCVIL
jgi:hypothetical protein